MKGKLNFFASQYKNEKISVKFFDENNKEIPEEQVKKVTITSGEDKGKIMFLKKTN